MSYNITNTNTGAVLFNGTVQNPATVGTGVYVTNTTASHGGDAIYGSASYVWTISNYGTVESDPTAGKGIDLAGGGVITNGAAASLIAGYVDGIAIAAAGIVANLGTIESTGAGGTAVYVGQGGSVDNEATGLSTGVISAGTGGDAVVIAGASGSVVNAGSITGGNLGVWLEAGGTAVNSGSITATDAGTGDGVTFGNAGSGAGSLLNTGQITAPNLAVWLEAGGYVINGVSGTISGDADGVLVSTSAGTVNNFGTIESTGGNGVYLAAGGLVVNQGGGGGGGITVPPPPGLISGYDGVRIAGAAGTGALLNGGNIYSTGIGFGAQAVDFLAGGTLYNYGSIFGINTDASGINAGFADDTIINGSTSNGSATIAGWLNGIDQFSGLGIVINFGTVLSSNGAGVDLQAGGYVSNSSTGSIQGSTYGIDVASGAATIVNDGLVHATNAGKSVGILLGGGGTVENYGTITSDGAGNFSGAIDMLATGRVVNAAGALIAGNFDGIEGNTNADFVTNFGMITAHERGVVLFAGGTVINGASTLTSSLISATAGVPTTGVDTGYGSAYVLNYGTLVGRSGVFGRAGVTITNHGLISAGGRGVYLAGTGGTVTNTGTISASNSPSYGVLMTLGGTVINSGLISGLDNGVRFGGGGVYGAARGNAGTVFNTGSILASGTGGLGVGLDFGGYVTNSTTGVIGGPDYGVKVRGSAGTVVNSGNITSSSGAGVYLEHGGSVTNNTGGAISGYGFGVRLGYFASLYSGTAINHSSIVATGTSYATGIYFHANGGIDNFGTISALGGSNGIGVSLQGGTLTNEVGALITASGRGVFGNGSVFNSGTIVGSDVTGIDASGDTYVSNSGVGVIEGLAQGIAVATNGTVINHGDITATGTYGPTGVYIRDVASVDNFGTIAGSGGTGGNGVNFGGGTITNESGALIAGSYNGGDGVRGTNGSVFNNATIQGDAGVALTSGGYVSNSSTGVIDGAVFGVIIGGTISGTVINRGHITATGDSYPDGVYLGRGTLDNFGTVNALSGVGVNVANGDAQTILTNESGGLISGSSVGVIFSGAGGSVNNLGTISGFSEGVGLKAPNALLTNSGSIYGPNFVGVYLYGGPSGFSGARVTNAGTGLIEGYRGILSTQSAANVVNLGTIYGADASGVQFNVGGGTLSNAGTIIASGGADAVHFTGSNNRLIVQPGAVFVGALAAYGGGGSNDTLEVASGTTGTISSGTYAGFDNLEIDAGASWTLSGSNTIGSTLSDFGTLTNSGNLIAGSIVVDPGTMINSGTITTTVTLDGNSYLDNTSTGTIGVAGTAVLGLNGPNYVFNAGSIIATGSPSYGIKFLAGGSVTNASTGIITGAQNDIYISGGAGTVSNAGALGGAVVAVRLFNGGMVTNAAGGSVSASLTGVEIDGTTGTLDNGGTIDGTGAASGAVYLTSGGYVLNRAGGLLVGAVQGVAVGHTAGTVVNAGAIQGTGASGGGIYLNFGGLISNASTGLIAGTADGVLIGHTAGTVDNRGSIIATGNGVGAELANGGLVANSGSIGGYFDGVVVRGTYGSISNLGTISASTTFGAGAYLAAGGSITNGSALQTGALIISNNNALSIFNAVGSVTNYGTLAAVGSYGYGAVLSDGGTITNSGTILETGTGGTAVRLGNGGILTNNSGGLIAGAGGGAYIFGSPGTVSNYGTIANSSSARSDVRIVAGGTVLNHGLIDSPRTGISFGSAGGTVDNFGVVVSTDVTAGSGAYFGQGGLLTNEAGGLISSYHTGVSVVGSAGTVVNFGTIAHTGAGTSGEAVYLGAGGTVTNYGLISGARPGTSGANGYPGAVDVQNLPATVVNLGTITNPNYGNGVNLIFGGTLINGSTADTTATIFGPHGGVAIGVTLNSVPTGGVGLVFNYGTIENAGSNASAVALPSGGTVTNRGLISSGRTGVGFGNTSGAAGVLGTVVNYGTIVSTAPISAAAGVGIELFGGGVVVNKAGASVIALRSAILDNGTTTAAATISNAGTLSGSIGIQIGLSDTGNNTIDNFGTITGSGGTAISLGGGADLVILEQGSTLSGAIANFAPGDTLDLAAVPFSTSDTVMFDGTTLTVSGGGVSVSVDLAGVGAATDFILESDSAGHAQIDPVISGSNLIVSSGQVLTVLSGQTVSNVTVEGGGVLDVASGGVASATLVSAGGTETVSSGGLDISATIDGGGFQDVFGTASGTLVVAGGSQTVEAGASATDTVLDALDQTLTFDDLPASQAAIPNGYGGFNWNNFDAFPAANDTPSGYVNGTVSPPNVAFNTFGSPSSFSVATGTFSVASFYLTAAWNDGLSVQVEGLLNGNVIDNTTFVVNATGGPTLETLNWSGIDELYFDSFGGTNVGYPGSGEQFALDNLTIGAGAAIQTVSSGGAASFTVVGSGDEQIVLSGGTAIGTNDAGLVVVSGVDSGATIASGGIEDVFGSAVGTLVLNGGSQTVEAGGIATGVVLDGTALQDVLGMAGGTVVSAGDEQLVEAGGVASGTTISGGGDEIVLSGGLTSNTTIVGGTLELVSGAAASGLITFSGSGGILELDSLTPPSAVIAGLTSGNTIDFRLIPFLADTSVRFDPATSALTVSEGGSSETLTISGGIAMAGILLASDGLGGTDSELTSLSGLVVSAGETLTILAGQTASGITVLSGAMLQVASGGTVIATVISGGGEEIVLSGGVDSSAVVLSGGFEDVYGSAVSTTVLNGGSQTVEAGGSVTGAVLDGIGVQLVFGMAGGTVVSAGDEQLVEAGGVASGTTISGGGDEIVLSGGLTSNTTIAGGTLDLLSGAAATGLITFSGSGGRLELDSLTPPAAAIAGLTGNVVDLRLIPFLADTSATFDPATSALTVSEGGSSETLTISGGIAMAGIVLTSDGLGGTDLALASLSGLVLSGGETLTISAGQTASGITVLSGATLQIASGGTAIGTVISGGGEEIVLSGGVDSSAMVLSGGFEDVYGSAVSTTVLNGGSQTVEAGGAVTGAVLDGIGVQLVFGFAGGTVVSAGDEQLVESGGLASGTVVLSGGMLQVLSGGVASAATISSGGESQVLSGGLDQGAAITGGGLEEVFGSAGGTLVLGGGELLVESGGVASAATISSGGFEEVSGSAVGTLVLGTLDVSGGTVSGAQIGSGGQENVFSGGIDRDATISNGGFAEVFGSGGGTLVLSGGTQLVEAGGGASGTTISSGGSELVLAGGVTSDTVIAGGQLEVEAGAAANGLISFSGGGALRLDSLVTPAATIGGLVAGDVIDLSEIGFATSDTATLDANNRLTVSGGGNSVSLQFDSSVAGKSFAISDDGSGGARLTLTNVTTTTRVFDFVFVYNDGKDYYLGTVADDGRLGYTAGETISATAGSYDIIDQATAPASEAVGAVFVTDYSHNGPGLASVVPEKTAAGTPDGTAGLGSEGDTLLGTDGLSHAFSSTQELSLATTQLYGFVYHYADGASYTGTVADDSSAGLPASLTETNPAGNVVGGYTIFSDGMTTRAAGTVVVDRFQGNGLSVPVNHSSATAVDGTAGLGSESGSVTVKGLVLTFSPTNEPTVVDPPPENPIDLAIGTTANGAVSSLDDNHSYKVTLTAGTLYSFNLDGTDISSSYTLRDPYLQLLDGFGNLLAANDDIGGGNWSSEIDYAATAGGTYYLVAGSSPSDGTYTTGSYQIRSSTPQPLAVDTTATGAIDYVGAKNFYSVALTAGTYYSFNLDGFDISSGYTLRDPDLQLLDSNGDVVAANDDIGSGNWSSAIDYIATTGGTYYLQASSSPSDSAYTTGSYQIRSGTPQPLAIGTTAAGAIDYTGAKDVYSVTLTAGTHYSFNLDGSDISSSYTLRDPDLQLLDSNGNVVAANDDIGGGNWSSAIDYTATSGGTYYLKASSSPSDGTYTTGSYQIRSATVPAAAASAAAASYGANSDSGATIVPISAGDQTVTANGRPEIFDFSSLSSGNDTIVGFDPTQDAIRLSNGLADSLATLQSDMSAIAAGTLITLDKTHSITLSGVAPNSLTAANFRFS